MHKLGLGMIISQVFLEDQERPFIAPFGSLQITQVLQHAAEVVDSNSHRGMIRAVDLLVDGQSPLVEFFSSLQISQDLSTSPRLLT